jgi:copper chaperone CopZ
MNTTVVIDNLQCEEGQQFIGRFLETLEGISNVSVDLLSKTVSFSFSSHNAIEGARIKLIEIGYPITHDPSIIKNQE